MDNVANLTSRFKKVGLNKTRKSFVGLKRAPSTRRITVVAKMKSKANARAEIERKEEELKAIRKAKLKATRNAKAAELKLARNANLAKLKAIRNADAAELKKLEEREKHVKANLNGLMNAFKRFNLSSP